MRGNPSLLRFPQVTRSPVPSELPRARRQPLPGAARPGASRAPAGAIATSVISMCPGQISACGHRDPPCYRALILLGHGLRSKAYYSVNDLVFSSEDLGQGLHAN